MMRAAMPGVPSPLIHAHPGSGIILEQVFSPQATPVLITHTEGSSSPLGAKRDKPASQQRPGGKISHSGSATPEHAARKRVKSLKGVTDSTTTFAVYLAFSIRLNPAMMADFSSSYSKETAPSVVA